MRYRRTAINRLPDPDIGLNREGNGAVLAVGFGRLNHQLGDRSVLADTVPGPRDLWSRFQPTVDNRFGLVPSVSRRPGRILIRCVDGAETLVNKGIKRVDACLFIDR